MSRERHTSSWKIKGGLEQGGQGRVIQWEPGCSFLASGVFEQELDNLMVSYVLRVFPSPLSYLQVLWIITKNQQKEIPWVVIIPLCAKPSHCAEVGVIQGVGLWWPLAGWYLPYCGEAICCGEWKSEDSEEGSDMTFLVMSFILVISSLRFITQLLMAKNNQDQSA